MDEPRDGDNAVEGSKAYTGFVSKLPPELQIPEMKRNVQAAQ
jgi:hypothetical protein